MKRSLIVLLALSVLMPVQALYAAESLESLEAGLKSAWEKQNSMSADVLIEATIPMGEGKLPLAGGGTTEYLKAGEKIMYRQVLSAKMPEPMTLGGKVDALFDGDDLYVTTDFMGKVETKKEKPALDKGAIPPGGGMLLEAIQGDFDIAIKPESDVEGATVYVLECTPKPGKEIPISKAMVLIEKASGVLRKVEIFDAANLSIATIETKNVKLNETIDPGRFVYTAPAAKAEEKK